MRLPVLVLALLPFAAQAQEAPPMPQPARVITVTGEGHSDRKPDTASVSLGVAEQAATAGEAMAAMGQGMTQVLGTLAQAGIAPADIQTGQLTLEAAYDYNSGQNPPPLTGYVATQIVDVRVRDVTKVGTVLDAVTKDGANRINGVGFGLDDQAAAMDEARQAAVNDARARAEFLTKAAGMTLGDLLQITEGGLSGGPQPMFDQRFAADAAATPVAPGQVTLTTTVTMTFAIE